MDQSVKSLTRALEKMPLALFAAMVFGVATGILVLATPVWLFERGVMASGLPHLVSAATPPLGDKARITAALVAMLGTVSLLWLITMIGQRLVTNTRPKSRRREIEADERETEHASHPDTPARRPLFAESDLGAPFMSDEAIAHARGVLVLEAIAPDDVPASDVNPARALEPAQEASAAPTGTAEPESIANLLDRLENALERRERRTGSAAPILPGDMAALRKALGGSVVHH